MAFSFDSVFSLIIALIQAVIWISRRVTWAWRRTGVTVPVHPRLRRWMARPQEAPLPTFITQQYFDDAMSEQTAMIRQFINPRFLNPGHPVDQTSRGEGTRLFQDMGTQTETDNELGLAQPLEAISHGTWIRRGIQRGKGKGDDAV